MSTSDDAAYKAALTKALKLLKSKDRLEAEVLRALSAYEPAIRCQVISELQVQSLLSDSRVVADHIEKRLSQDRGLEGIKHELLNRGAGATDVDQAAQKWATQEIGRATELARKLVDRGRNRRKTARLLQSRGFDAESVESALDRLGEA